MTASSEKFEIGLVLRPMGLLLLILVFVFQLVAPPASATRSVVDVHAHHQEMTNAANRCPMHSANLDANAPGGAELDGTHENAAHCMPSMCCFHDTVSSSQLVTIGALLPSTQVIDRGTAPSSNTGSTQDRPPRHV